MITLEKDIFLIAGLGNPGREYRNTRHNVGFMAMDRLADFLHKRFSRLQSKALVVQAEYLRKKLILAKPQTFMNLSGKSIRGLARFYKIPFSQMLIIHDDIDLPLGALRIRPDGGSGGQKGMASIQEMLGTDEFPRIRIGIGRPPGSRQAPDYVLDDFSTMESKVISDTLDTVVEAALLWVKEDLNSSMNKFNMKNS
jgi:peptidyl-tRNA hydrolase, PTH1 family